MKQIRLWMSLLMIVGIVGQSWGQTTILTESFETTSGYTFPNGNGGSSQDFFDRTDLTGAPAQKSFTYSGFDQTYFIAGEDIDGTLSSSAGVVQISNINVSGYTGLTFTAAFASGTDADIDDANDAIIIEARLDNGAWTEIGRFEADPSTTNASGSNGQFAEDTDGDGDGDGARLDGTFTDFTFTIPGSGGTLDVRVTLDLNSADEEAAFDNVRIEGNLQNPNDLTTTLKDPGQPAASTVQADQVDTKTNGFAVLDFVVEDLASGDNKATEITQIQFEAGTQNNIDWADELRGFQLDTSNNNNQPVFDTSDFASWSISSGTITATFNSGDWIVADGKDDTASLYVWLKDIGGITDGGQIQMEIPTNHGFGAATSGSGFENPIPSAITGNTFTVDVVASALRFATQPTNTPVSQTMNPGPVVELVNGNDALDIDASQTVNLSSSPINFDGAATTSVSSSSGVATFSNLLFSSTASGVTLDANASGLSSLTSNSFDVISSAPALLISQYVETSSGSTPKGIEVWNLSGSTIDFSTQNLLVERYTNGSSSATTEATVSSGTLAAGEVLVIGSGDLQTYMSNNYPSVLFVNDGFVFNGNDAVEVKLGGTTVDVIGQIGNDPGNAWAGTGVSTKDQNISLKLQFKAGDIIGGDSYDPSVRYETVVSNVSAGTGDLTGFGEPPYSVYDGSWSNGGFSGGAPSNDFYVASGTTSVTGDQTIAELVVAAGATVAIHSSHSLTTDDITNDGTITIADNAALVQNTSTTHQGSGTYKVDNQTTYPNPAAFKYWSSPVSGETMGDVFGNTTHTDWYNWSPGPASNTANWKTISSSYTLEAGRGFITTPENTGNSNITETRTFEGDIHNGPITYSAGSLNAGDFILVGNPYPSAIDNAKFVADNSNLQGTLHYWNHVSNFSNPVGGDYASWNGTGSVSKGNGNKSPNDYTAAMQGFFVEVATGGSIDVTFENDQRVSGNNGQFFKQTGPDTRQRAWLRASHDSGASNQILIGLLDQATDGRDRLYDGRKLKGNPNLAFYSILGQKDLAIQALDQDLKNDKVIPLGLYAGQPGRYTIALDSLDNWPGHTLALLDSAQGTVTNLKQNHYAFAVNQSGPIRGRFYLLISSDPFVGVGLEEARSGELLYFQRGDALVVDSHLQSSPLEQVILRSVSGRNLRQAAPGTLRHELAVGDLPQGVYLLEAQNQAGETSHHKVYLK